MSEVFCLFTECAGRFCHAAQTSMNLLPQDRLCQLGYLQRLGGAAAVSALSPSLVALPALQGFCLCVSLSSCLAFIVES